jgi:hypothetical protein
MQACDAATSLAKLNNSRQTCRIFPGRFRHVHSRLLRRIQTKLVPMEAGMIRFPHMREQREGSTMRRRDFLALATMLTAALAWIGDAAGVDSVGFVWTPDEAPDGPTRVVVDIGEQHVYVYRNGVLIGESTVSTGTKGHPTPRGTFTILEKKVFHRSNKYSNAPMPHMQRLTWSGIAMHGGHVTGRPASHGCVRLPPAFARALYEATGVGTIVVIQ